MSMRGGRIMGGSSSEGGFPRREMMLNGPWLELEVCEGMLRGDVELRVGRAVVGDCGMGEQM